MVWLEMDATACVVQDDRKINFTKHAVQRSEERDIDLVDIAERIFKVFDRLPTGKVKLKGDSSDIVINRQEDRLVKVVTVYNRGEPAG